MVFSFPQVSGDGKLSSDALNPESSSSAHFISLEIYLTSPSLNLTVSQGPGLLSQEQGSTVKHINWLIDSCVSSGNYNVSLCLCSHYSQVAQVKWNLD